jgi:hypothetical protein
MTTETKPVNPIVEQGLLLTPEEYEVVSAGLFALAQQAQGRKGAKHVHLGQLLQGVLVRLQNAQCQGNGLPDEILKLFDQRIAAAYETGSIEPLARAIRDLIAATFRADADAAHKVAQYLLKLLDRARRTSNATLLDEFSAQLEDAKREWTDNKDWPSAQDVTVWVVQTLDGAAANLRDGFDAFPKEDA